MGKVIEFPKKEEQNKKKVYLSHERLINLIIFVLMDQLILSYDNYQKTKDEEILKYHDALLSMKEDVKHLCAIEKWVDTYKHYIRFSESNCIISHQYYNMIMDGITIEYCYAFKAMDVDNIAKDCVAEYEEWT